MQAVAAYVTVLLISRCYTDFIMIEYLFLIPISLFLLIGVMSPGPSFILVAQTALSKSKKDAVAVSIGMGVGSAIFAIIASLGLFVLLESVPWVYTILKIIGGCYLCFLACKMWQSSKGTILNHKENGHLNNGSLTMFSVGLLTQLSNPKTAIVFAIAFAAFLPKEMPEYSYVIVVVLAFMIDTLWYVFVSILLSSCKAQMVYSKFKSHICKIASGFMGVMGIKLMTSENLP